MLPTFKRYAKAANSNTMSSTVLGSVHYTSPEQARGAASDARSDIYSLGITMYEMVTGRLPFDGDTAVAVAVKHLQEEIVSPAEYVPELPYSLEQIILKCTQKRPEFRYPDVASLVLDLKRSLVDPEGDFVRIRRVPGSDTVMLSEGELQKLQQIHISDDCGQRCFQIVGNIGDQLRLHLLTFDLFVYR